MRIKTIISSLILFACLSCETNNEVPEANGNRIEKTKKTVPPPPPPDKYHTNFQDGECKNQIDSARQDVKNGKLVYEDNSGAWAIIRYDNEMEEILKEYGIEYKKTGPNCVFEQECYGYFMDSIISQRFGEGFIKQVEERADSLFLSRWKTKTYESWDIDEPPFYKKGDAEIYIENRIRYPKNWDSTPMESERQYITVDVYIDNDGKLISWELHELYNLKESNKKLLPELKKQINQIIKDMVKWRPGQLNGKAVNSKIWLDIDLDEER